MILYFLCGIALFDNTNLYGQHADLTPFKTYFDNQLKGWTKTFNTFSLASFEKYGSTAFENIDYMDIEDVQDFYTVYKPALSFSPDKKQFLDIYSYWLALEKEGKTIVSRGGEPDQVISLCNFKTRKWTRILFQGTTERIQDALWISNSKFILVGTRENASGKQSPVIYLGDIVTKTFKVFILKKAVRYFQKSSGYNSPKLLRLKIKQL
jgi:hypothetical protein